MTVIPLKPPRGVRARNPGNIRKSHAEWLGEIEGFDPDFETFASPEYGIRAMARILLTYFRKHRLKTVAAIISRWAPPNENDTQSYIEHVCRVCAVDRQDELNVADPDVLHHLVLAIIRHENGRAPDKSDWYDAATIERGVKLALENMT
jgi:hypothetical protein